MTLHRRDFLKLVGAVAAATGLPPAGVAQALEARPDAARAAAELTTLAQTLGPGNPVNDLGYRPVVSGDGEPHIVRDDLVEAQPGREGRRQSLLVFVHLTDQHVIDTQSTTRVEFLARYSDGECGQAAPFQSAHRPQEAANARIADAMLRRIRRIGVSPVTGTPITAGVCTGDNTDNQQANELDVFLKVMDGGQVTPQSGDPDRYEGVQRSGDRAYWHPDPDVTSEPDVHKALYGFPDAPGWLEEALAAFNAGGAGVHWYSAYGNHDGLAQGNAPVNPAFEGIGTGPLKVNGTPETVACDASEDPSRFGELFTQPGQPVMEVTPDPERRYISRREWMQGHLDAPGLPNGHGFTQENIDRNVGYYTTDVGPLRWIVLDTVNPGGYASGSIGQAQLDWLDAELARAQDEEQLTVLFSHHGLRSLDNPAQNPDPLAGEDGNDLPRHMADSVLAVVSQYPCVIAWVNGHTHRNVIETREGPFWDIGTAAHIDWPAQSRIIEVADNRDGTISIFTTNVDHEDDDVASFARELMANDPQKGFGYGEGAEEDRNAELLIPHPFAAAGEQPTEAPTERPTPANGDGNGAAGPRPSRALPATGLPAGLTVGGALLTAGAIGLRRFAARAAELELTRSAGPPDPDA